MFKAPLLDSFTCLAQALKNTVFGVPAGLCDAKIRRVCANAAPLESMSPAKPIPTNVRNDIRMT
jgi:hypothetical protein